MVKDRHQVSNQKNNCFDFFFMKIIDSCCEKYKDNGSTIQIKRSLITRNLINIFSSLYFFLLLFKEKSEKKEKKKKKKNRTLSLKRSINSEKLNTEHII